MTEDSARSSKSAAYASETQNDLAVFTLCILLINIYINLNNSGDSDAFDFRFIIRE